jgi:hypothetical protein
MSPERPDEPEDAALLRMLENRAPSGRGRLTPADDAAREPGSADLLDESSGQSSLT